MRGSGIYYALYKGDDYVSGGTLIEIAQLTKLPLNTLQKLKTPHYKKSVRKTNRQERQDKCFVSYRGGR